MLQEIRKYAKSWVSSVFLGGLALSFALWGIADIFRGSADTTVFSIGSVQMGADLFSREYHNVMRNARTALTPEQSKLAGEQILDRMIAGTALDLVVSKLGLTTTDARIRAQVQEAPAFKGPLGTFDHATFVQILARAGYSESEFIATMRKDSARDQMLRSVEGGFLMPPDYARAIYAYINELRAAEYIVLTPAMVGAVKPPSDAVLANYIKNHADRFSTPEYRSVSYASIGVDDVAPTITVSDRQVQDELDKQKIKTGRTDFSSINKSKPYNYMAGLHLAHQLDSTGKALSVDMDYSNYWTDPYQTIANFLYDTSNNFKQSVRFFGGKTRRRLIHNE